MNFRLIFLLSLFGLAMAFATVYFIPSTIEPIFWLMIFLVCAFIIARQASGKYFLHGFLVSIFNSIWITAAHVALADTYLPRHPQEVALAAKMPALSPRLMMLVMGPVIGIISGLVLGLFSWVASKLKLLTKKS
jgi:hypothetical protein